jgi:hypothetical protein
MVSKCAFPATAPFAPSGLFTRQTAMLRRRATFAAFSLPAASPALVPPRSGYSRASPEVDEFLRRQWLAASTARPGHFPVESRTMLRAFFLALGIFSVVLGVECLVIEKAVLTPSRDSSALANAVPTYREIVPADWAPWSLLSGGAVVILYSFTIPAKMRS